jgi:SAM-dependent methyltransferase
MPIMKIGIKAENPIERAVLALGMVPTPLFETMMTMLLARTVMVATKLGVFEALAPAPLGAEDVARRCGTHPQATAKLLNALAGAGYARLDADRYSLTPLSRKWLLKDGPQSLHDNVLFRFMEWDLVGHYEEFIRSGVPLEMHATLKSEDGWSLYQRGMRSLAALSASEVAQRTPVPAGARDLLDIGGSHGYNAVVLCRRHAGLRAVIFDLPAAVEQAAPILAKEGMGDRVVHRAGDALADDLGAESWDVVFVAQLVHHFDAATNRELARRVARALRPGGVFVIQEAVRPSSPKQAGQAGTLLDLYFALTSQAGTWSYDEMADWQRQAGLEPRKPIRFRTVPGVGQQVAVKRG